MATTVDGKLTNEETIALENLLLQMSELSGKSLREYVDGIRADVEKSQADAIAKLQGQLSAITEMDDNGVESLAEKIKHIQDMLGTDDTVQTIVNLIKDNKDFTKQVEERVSALEASAGTKFAGIDASLSNLDAKITKNVSDLATINKTVNEVSASVEGLSKSVDDKFTEFSGNVETQIKTVQTAANAYADKVVGDVLNTAKSYTDGKVAQVQTELEALKGDGEGSLGAIESKVADLETSLKGKMDETGNVIEGIEAVVERHEKAISDEIVNRAKAVADLESKMQTQIDNAKIVPEGIDPVAIVNKFREGLGLNPVTAINDGVVA